jgi:hypothetical protein
MAISFFSDKDLSIFLNLLDSLFKKDWYINVGKDLHSLEFTIAYI